MVTETDLILGNKIADSAGEKVGTIEVKYLDPTTESTDWLAVGTGFLGRKHRLVPLRGAEDREGMVHLAYSKDTITAAPELPDDGILTEALEQELYKHYELDWSEYDAERNYGDRRIDFQSDEAPVTYGEDSEIRDPERGTRPDASEMVLPEHSEGIRPHPSEDAAVETTGPIKPPTRAGGDDDPSELPDN